MAECLEASLYTCVRVRVYTYIDGACTCITAQSEIRPVETLGDTRGFVVSRYLPVTFGVSSQKAPVLCPNYSSQEIKLGGKSCICLMHY